MTDAKRKRLLKRAYKAGERAQARQEMVLNESQLQALLDYLDERGAGEGCDHSLRLTAAWVAEASVDFDALAESLSEFGGYCDCEVLANVAPGEIF
jgi:hypothetical protein